MISQPVEGPECTVCGPRPGAEFRVVRHRLAIDGLFVRLHHRGGCQRLVEVMLSPRHVAESATSGPTAGPASAAAGSTAAFDAAADADGFSFNQTVEIVETDPAQGWRGHHAETLRRLSAAPVLVDLRARQRLQPAADVARER